MRALLFANGALGARVARWLASRSELAGLVLNVEPKRRGMDGLAEELGVSAWGWPAPVDEVAATDPDVVASVLFAHKLGAEWLTLGRRPAVNLHPGHLPWNRGADPAVWPLVDGSPAGTTLHVMSERIDEGSILLQRKVEVFPVDTAADLYERLMVACWDLFVDAWPRLDDLEPTDQPPGGTSHARRDLATLDPTQADLPLLDRLRARTFPPYGAEVERDGHRYRIRVEVEDLGPVESG